MLCALQYWLLTATVEAYHGGDRSIPLVAFLASLACFVLAIGLVVTGERASARRHRLEG
jgi:hypothetical protein